MSSLPKILYINLDKAVDRRKIMESQFKKHGIQATRIPGVYGKNLNEFKYRKNIADLLGVHHSFLDPEFWLNRSNFKTMCNVESITMAKVGCYLSHALLLKYAYDKNYNSIVVLEDNSKILPSFFHELNVPLDSDIVYIGGSVGDEFKIPRKSGVYPLW